MNRDVLITVGGLVVVGVVVIATFLYGDQQRQNQLREDRKTAVQQQEAKPAETKTESSKAETAKKAENKPVATESNEAKPQQPAIKKPSGSEATNVQGGRGGATTTKPLATQPTPNQTPRTGSGVLNVLGATLMAITFISYWRGRNRAQAVAIRS